MVHALPGKRLLTAVQVEASFPMMQAAFDHEDPTGITQTYLDCFKLNQCNFVKSAIHNHCEESPFMPKRQCLELVIGRSDGRHCIVGNRVENLMLPYTKYILGCSQ